MAGAASWFRRLLFELCWEMCSGRGRRCLKSCTQSHCHMRPGQLGSASHVLCFMSCSEPGIASPGHGRVEKARGEKKEFCEWGE